MPIISGGTQQSKHENELRQSFTGQTPTTSNSLTRKTPPPTTTEMEQAPPSLTSPLQPRQQQSPSPAGQLMRRHQQDLIIWLFVLTLQPPHCRTQLYTLSANNSTAKRQTGHSSVPPSTPYPPVPWTRCNNTSTHPQPQALNRPESSYETPFSRLQWRASPFSDPAQDHNPGGMMTSHDNDNKCTMTSKDGRLPDANRIGGPSSSPGTLTSMQYEMPKDQTGKLSSQQQRERISSLPTNKPNRDEWRLHHSSTSRDNRQSTSKPSVIPSVLPCSQHLQKHPQHPPLHLDQPSNGLPSLLRRLQVLSTHLHQTRHHDQMACLSYSCRRPIRQPHSFSKHSTLHSSNTATTPSAGARQLV